MILKCNKYKWARPRPLYIQTTWAWQTKPVTGPGRARAQTFRARPGLSLLLSHPKPGPLAPLVEYDVTKLFWCESLLTSCYLINHMPSLVLGNIFQCKLLYANKPLFKVPPRVFRYACFVQKPGWGDNKLSVFSWAIVCPKGYKCYSPQLMRRFVCHSIMLEKRVHNDEHLENTIPKPVNIFPEHVEGLKSKASSGKIEKLYLRKRWKKTITLQSQSPTQSNSESQNPQDLYLPIPLREKEEVLLILSLSYYPSIT